MSDPKNLESERTGAPFASEAATAAPESAEPRASQPSEPGPSELGPSELGPSGPGPSGPGPSGPGPSGRAPSKQRSEKITRRRRVREKAKTRSVDEGRVLDANGRERPRFLLRLEQHPELEPLVSAYELGDYATVRKLATELLAREPSRKVREGAEEFLERIRPDPLIKYLLVASVALLLFMILYVYRSPVH